MAGTWLRVSLALVAGTLLFAVTGCSDSKSTPAPASAPKPLSLSTPVRLATGDAGVLLVTDYDNNAVLELDPSDLHVVGSIAVAGKPTGLARSGNEVFVGNESKGSVEVYDLASGHYLRRLGASDGLIGLPNGIVVDETAGIVYVVDSASKTIKRFNFDGSSAGADLGGGILASPTALTLDPVNHLLFISDYGEPLASFGDTPSIQILDAGGVLRARIEGATLDFDRPQGLALNGSGKLFVAEGVAGVVLVFDVSDLSAVVKLPSLGSGLLKMPLDVLLDPGSSDLYVTSSLGGEVVVFPGGGA